MKVFLDENLSAAIVHVLRERGIDAVHARDAGFAAAADEAILDWCRKENRVAITRDADFHAILAQTGVDRPSVVRIRIEPISEPDLIRIIEWIVREKQPELERGVAMTVKRTSTRIRDLPLTVIGDGDM